MEIQVGDIVLSLRGRDQGDVFLVIKTEASRVALVDEKTRNELHPKWKNRKHVQRIGSMDEFDERNSKTVDPTKKDLRRLLARCKANLKPDQEG